jgi:phosphoserine aminotransferase
LANPSKTYDFIDIQYYYSGDAEDVQRSKKMITLAIPTDAMVGSDTLTKTLIAAITSAGVTVKDLTQ